MEKFINKLENKLINMQIFEKNKNVIYELISTVFDCTKKEQNTVKII